MKNKIGVVVGKVENKKLKVSLEEVERGSEQERAIFGEEVNAEINDLLNQVGELLEKHKGHFCFMGSCNDKLQICASEPQSDLQDYLEQMTKAILGAFIAKTEFVVPLYRAMLGAVLAAPSYNKELVPHVQQILSFFAQFLGMDVDSQAFKDMMRDQPKEC